MTGFPNPLEKTEETDLAFTERNWKFAVIPPPIMIAIAQWIIGSNPVITDNDKIIPAIIDSGVATVSSILSIQGLKYPIISARENAANIIINNVEDIHSKLGSKSSKPIELVIPSIRNGIKILKPQAALKPIPKNILSKFSNFKSYPFFNF